MKEIIYCPELILSVIILGLVTLGIKYSIYRLSIGVLFLVWALFLFGAVALIPGELSFNIWMYNVGVGEYYNEWVNITKLLIIMGAVAIVLMGPLKMWPMGPSSGSYEGVGSIISRVGGLSPFPLILLLVTLSSLLLVSSMNWLSLYLALEFQTLSLFVLVALKRDSAYSTEAGLKYFVLGALSSGLFLFGCALLYGLTGEVSIQEIILVTGDLGGDLGGVLITIALLFKLSAVPFHMWAPDVYEGAPILITALLALIPKVAIVGILVQIGVVMNLILLCAVLSIIYGAIAALNQTRIKRLLAYSGISHMGFILLGLAVGTFESIQASYIYLIIYLVMSIGGFSMVMYLNLRRGLIIEMAGLSRENPVLAISLGLTFLAIAGIPPLVGFLSKWLLLLSAVSAGYYLISIVAVVSSVVAGVYYVRIVKIIYFQTGSSLLIWQSILHRERCFNRALALRLSTLMGGSFYLITFLMMCPNLLMQITHEATLSLY